MYSNIETERVRTYVVTSGASDHFSTLTKIIDCKSTIISKQVIYSRTKTLTKNEIIAFNRDLDNLLKNNEVVDTNDTHENTKYLISSYQKLIDKYMPLRKMSNKEKKSLAKPWITRGIKKSIAVRDKLLRKSTKNKCAKIYDEYKYYRNLITRLKKNSFNMYYKNKLKDNFKNRKKNWETINEITNHKIRKKTEIKSLKGKNGEEFRQPSDIANCLNEHFNSIGHKMADKIDKVTGTVE